MILIKTKLFNLTTLRRELIFKMQFSPCFILLLVL